VPILRALCGALVINCLNIPSTLVLLATNRQRSYFTVYMLGALINIVGGIVLVHFFQVDGVLFAIYLTELFITIGVLFESFRHEMVGSPQT
jgi:O-antigen/teichoic acid export membrane protein